MAPYVLLGLFYNGNGPKAIINTNLAQQTIPACSILGVPYAHSFENKPHSTRRAAVLAGGKPRVGASHAGA